MFVGWLFPCGKWIEDCGFFICDEQVGLICWLAVVAASSVAAEAERLRPISSENSIVTVLSLRKASSRVKEGRAGADRVEGSWRGGCRGMFPRGILLRHNPNGT